MIVQCKHCQTKYRIPDEKVKGKGVKVRCAKCNNTFTVLPAGAVPGPLLSPSEPGQPSVPGASSAGKPTQTPSKESGSSSSEAAPPVGEPGPPGPSEQEGPLPGVAPPGGDFLPPFSSGKIPVTGEEPGLPPLSQDRPPEEDRAEPSSGPQEPPPAQGEEPETGSHRPAHERDKATEEPPSTEDTALPGFPGFEIESTLRDNLSPPPGSKAASSGVDLQESLPPEEGIEGWGNISLGPEPDLGAELGEINLAGGTPDRHIISPSDTERVFPDTGSGISQPPPATKQAAGQSFHAKPVSPKKSRKGLVFLLVLAILGAGGYFGYPRIMKIIGDQGGKPGGTLTPDNIQVRSLTLHDGKVVYTVTGQVRNSSSVSVGMIQVEAQFRNGAGDIVATSNSFCGNVFKENQILTGDLAKIRTDLQNELGQSLSNSNIRPGQTVPFLVVLETPPAGISKVTVTISGFKETT